MASDRLEAEPVAIEALGAVEIAWLSAAFTTPLLDV
jgi:hypothetical protein